MTRWIPSPYGPVTDFYASVDVRMLQQGAEGLDVGLMFGRAANRDYKLLVNSRGYVGVSRAQGTDNNMLVDWTPASARLDTGIRLSVFVRDGRMAFYVNDNQFGEIKDDAFTGGTVGLSVGAYGRSAATIVFDNFELRRSP